MWERSDKTFPIQWHITDKCDQRCKHCYIYAGENKLGNNDPSFENLKIVFYSYLDMCKKINARPSITLTGGDPLLRADIWNFLEMLHGESIEFRILGNPFHLNEEIAIKLKAMGCISYQLSLDGLKETHDFIRKPGSFDETVNKIGVLNKAGIKSAIMTTVSRTNIEEIPDLVDVIVENNVKVFGFSRYCPNENDEGLLVSPTEYREFLDKMWKKFEYYKNSKTKFILKDHLWTLFLYEKDLFKIEDNSDQILDGCHCGISHITVLPNGNVYACRRCDSVVGHIPEESLYDIFFGSKMDEYRDFSRFEKCSKCELLRFCRGCPSVAKSLTGNYYAGDPQCWKII